MHDPSRFEGELGRGVYDARRAAALAGVPERTLHYWAATGLYVPSVSPEPYTRLWSWLDLLALRAIDWFRKSKAPGGPRKTSVRRLRQALEELDRLEIPRERLRDFLVVSLAGEPFIGLPGLTMRADAGRQGVSTDILPVVAPYESGPDLVAPRPRLRIIPGKLLGEPHLANTRIPSATIFALHQDGYRVDQIHSMYPEASLDAITDAIDLEQSLIKRAA